MRRLVLLLLLACGLGHAPALLAVTCTTQAGTLWGTAGNWNCGHVPAVGDDVIVNRTFTVNTNTNNIATLQVAAGITLTQSSTLTMSGALTVSGTLNSTNSMTISGLTTVSGLLSIGATTGTHTYAGVTVNNGGTFRETVNEAINYGGNVTVDTGGTLTEFAGGGAAMTFPGDFINNGTYSANAGTHTFSAATGTIGGSSAITIASFTVNGAYTNINTAGLTIATAFAGNSTLTNGDGVVRAILQIQDTAFTAARLNASAVNNLVRYNLGGNQTVAAVTYHDLELATSGTKTMTGVTTINGDLTISGTATMTGNAGFTVAGALNYSSTGGTTLTAATPISIGTYNQTAGTFTGNNNTITVTGTGAAWSKTGTFTPGTGTVNFTGDAPQIGASNFNNLTISVSGTTATATLTGNATPAGNLTVSTGTLDLSTFTANRTAAGGTLTVANGATLLIGGTNPFPTNYNTDTLGATSTVNYDGTNQSVTNQVYGNLTLSGSGTKTMPGTALTVATDFTMQGTAVATTGNTLSVGGAFALAGTSQFTAGAAVSVTGDMTLGSGTSFSAASFTHSVQGNFTNNGATFTRGTSRFNFNGTLAQTIGGTASTTFNNLTINNAAGVTLNVDTTVAGAAAGALTLTSGIVSTGANALILSANCNVATVTRTTGFVAGLLRKTVPTGANITCTYEVGGADAPTNYRPIGITFASVTAANPVTGSVSQASSDHPQIATSGIDSGKDVNRYWTLTNGGVTFTTYSVTLNFVAGDIDAAASGLTSLFEIERWDGAAWQTTTAGAANATNTTASGINSMSDFIVGRKKVKSFGISVPGTSDTCSAVNVTFTAKDGAGNTMTDYTGTMNITTSTSKGDWAVVSGGGTFNNGTAGDGAASYAFASGDNGSATLALSNITINSSVQVSAVDSTGSGSSTSSAIVYTGNFFSITNDTIQVAGKSQTMSATLKQGAACLNTLTGYTGSKNLKFWYTRDVDDPGGTAPSISGMTSPPLGTSVPGANNVTLTFTNGVSANFSLVTTDVGKYTISMRDDGHTFASSDLNGTSSTITTQPFALVVSAIKQGATNNPANSGSGGSVFAKAGSAFQATVGSYLWNAAADLNNDGVPDGAASFANITASGKTPSYKWPTTLSGGTPITPVGGTTGTFGGGSLIAGDFSAGAATPASLTYSEVGSFTLSASASNFLNSGINLTAIVFDNSGTPARNGVVGRFTPDHFTLTASTLTNRSALACAPASSFSYLGEGIGLTLALVAQSSSNATTTNYTTASGFAKLDPTVPASFSFGAKSGTTNLTARTSATSSSGSWTNGSAAITATVNVARAASPDGPYTGTQLGIAPVDSDGVAMGTLDQDVDGVGGNDHKTVGAATEVRFGRVRLLGANGPTNLALPLAIRAEYWSGTGFATNTSDSCTTLAQSVFALGSYAKNLSACKTRVSDGAGGTTIAFSSGVGKMFLDKPGAGNDGSVVLTANLGSTASGSYCPTVGGVQSSATAAGVSYLQGAWNGVSTYDQNPTARAAFGVFGAQPNTFIFQRENY